MTGKNRIMIYGPKDDGTYVVEFKTADAEALAISIPRSDAAVIRHFQERMPTGCSCPMNLEAQADDAGALLTVQKAKQMAKRKMLFQPDYVRQKIRTSQLINRLQKFAFGEIELTMTQVRAIEILLRKSVPDLAAVEIKSEQTHRYVVEVPPLLDRDEWQRKYGQSPRPPRLQ